MNTVIFVLIWVTVFGITIWLINRLLKLIYKIEYKTEFFSWEGKVGKEDTLFTLGGKIHLVAESKRPFKISCASGLEEKAELKLFDLPLKERTLARFRIDTTVPAGYLKFLGSEGDLSLLPNINVRLESEKIITLLVHARSALSSEHIIDSTMTLCSVLFAIFITILFIAQ